MNLAILYSSGDNDETRHSKIKISAVTDVVAADQRDSDVNVGIDADMKERHRQTNRRRKLL